MTLPSTFPLRRQSSTAEPRAGPRGILRGQVLVGNTSLSGLIPSLVLLLGALFVWVARRRSDRLTWGLATVFALGAWLTVLLVLPTLPAGLELSAWRPASLFASRLEISLDRPGWGILYLIATGLLAILLTAAARPAAKAAGSRAVMLAYTALAMLAVMAGNLLTVAILWMLIDLLAFVYLVARVEDVPAAQALVGRLAIDMAGTLLALAAAAASFAGTLELPFGARPGPLLPTAFLALAVLLRLGLLPLHFTTSPLPHVRQGLGTMMRMLPAAAALGVLARTLGDSMPAGVSPWLLIAGAIGGAAGAIRWFLAADPLRGRTSLVLAVAGVGVISAVSHPAGPAVAISSAAAILVAVIVIASLTEIRTPWHRAWPLLGCVLLIGLPWTPGGVLMAGVFPARPSILTGIGAALGTLALVLIIAGLARLAGRAAEPWPAGETLVKTLYGLGLALPSLALAGYGVLVAQPPTLGGLAGLLAVGMGLAFGWTWRGRLEGRQVQRWTRLAAWLDPMPLYAIVWRTYRGSMNAVRRIGEAVEGEGAFLWVLVALLAVAIVLRGPPP